MAEDVRKLKDQAAIAIERGHHRRAAELFEQIAKLDPDPLWPQRAGETWRRLKFGPRAISLLTIAAEGYARQGFLLKAIAVCKVILEIDRTHERTQEVLSALYARRLVPDEAHAPRRLSDLGGRVPAPPAPSPPRAAEEQLRKPTTIPLEVEDLSFTTGEQPAMTASAPAATRTAKASPEAPSLSARDVPGSRDSAEFAAIEVPLEGSGPRAIPDPSAAALPHIPLFSSLGEAPLRRLIDQISRVVAPRGQVIVQQGEEGRALFVIVTGTVDVSVSVNGISSVVGTLGEGEFFGELSVLTKFRRSATVTAATDAELLSIDRKVIADLIRESPPVLRVLLRFFRSRMIGRLVASSPLFSKLSPEDAKQLTERFQFLEFEPAAKLISQGKAVPGLFIIVGGLGEILRRDHGVELPVGPIGPGELVGEMALLDATPATLTVRAATRLWALALPRAAFDEVVRAHPQLLEYFRSVAAERRQQIGQRLL